jgi:hypothetical protein
MGMRLAMWGTAAAVYLAFAGCAAKRPVHQRLVDRWGIYSVDEGFQLRVSTLGMSQMTYELWHLPSQRLLVKDLGRATRGWFFMWDDRDRLWAHCDDAGTVVWVASPSGRFLKNRLQKGDPLLNQMPPEVSAHLPQSVKQSLALHEQ